MSYVSHAGLKHHFLIWFKQI